MKKNKILGLNGKSRFKSETLPNKAGAKNADVVLAISAKVWLIPTASPVILKSTELLMVIEISDIKITVKQMFRPFVMISMIQVKIPWK